MPSEPPGFPAAPPPEMPPAPMPPGGMPPHAAAPLVESLSTESKPELTGDPLIDAVPFRSPHAAFLKVCIDDALDRLLLPSLEREIRSELTDEAELHAVKVFAHNIRSLLMQPPLIGRRVLAIDPGFRTGCKLAALDEFGNLIDHTVIFPLGAASTGPRRKEKEKKAEAARIRARAPSAGESEPDAARQVRARAPAREHQRRRRSADRARSRSGHAIGRCAARRRTQPPRRPPWKLLPLPPNRRRRRWTSAPKRRRSSSNSPRSTTSTSSPSATAPLAARPRKSSPTPSPPICPRWPTSSSRRPARRVYSVSPIAKEEFPNLDATLRSGASIGRRLQDPLSELVKIDPQSLGVGLYQHDMGRKELKEALEGVVESCVNQVGVDVNTASVPLLRYVSGLNQMVAREIVEYRKTHGPFTSREQLLQVSGMGPGALHAGGGVPQDSDRPESARSHLDSSGKLPRRREGDRGARAFA